MVNIDRGDGDLFINKLREVNYKATAYNRSFLIGNHRRIDLLIYVNLRIFSGYPRKFVEKDPSGAYQSQSFVPRICQGEKVYVQKIKL
jgi:hypothetical protein